MTTVLILAGKEVRDAVRNRWVVSMVLVFTGFAALLALIGSAPAGTVKASPLEVAVASLSSLSIYLVPLIALMVAYDAIVGEFERGTIFLLFAYPVARWQVVAGKFLGHAAILIGALAVGFGVPGLVLALLHGDFAGWLGYVAMMAWAAGLGCIFLALGYVVSTVARERTTAAGLAIALWLILVVLYDLALLGVLVADEHQVVGPSLFSVLLLVNPTDVFRLLALAGSEGARFAAGMAGAPSVPVPILLGVLAAWLALPLGAAVALFGRREL
jgi:Cu-processing system permease protein